MDFLKGLLAKAISALVVYGVIVAGIALFTDGATAAQFVRWSVGITVDAKEQVGDFGKEISNGFSSDQG